MENGQSDEKTVTPTTLKPEAKFYKEVKKSWKQIQLTRIENLSIPGVPDLLCYNKNGVFFTVELKVSTGNKIRFSPHQISFHVRHPYNTFILVKSLASSCSKLYLGEQIEELDARGLKLDACCSELAACGLWLDDLVNSKTEACGLQLDASGSVLAAGHKNSRIK